VTCGCTPATARKPASHPPAKTVAPVVSAPATAPPAATEPPAIAVPEVLEPDPGLMADEPPRCPPEMVLVLDDICIDRWEGSLVEVASGKAWSAFQSLDGRNVAVRAISKPGVTPQGYISGVVAERACQASGKRLCTSREWQTACRGPKRTTYPYGDERRAGICNDDGRALHPVAEVTKRLGLPPDRMWYEGMDHPMINQLDDTVRKAGELEQCTNETGAFDMVGNLHEWIEDEDGTFLGGFYMDTLINGEGCDYATTAHSKKYHDYSTGFRCCLDADAVE
jgi:Sulfatase-modifying factor enzyme 1